VIAAANAAGLDVFVDTPGGKVLVTPAMAQGVYANYPMYTQARSLLSTGLGNLAQMMTPPVMLAVGAVGIGLYMMMKR
jgi:hypothetical protein